MSAHDFSTPSTYDRSMNDIPMEVLQAARIVTEFMEKRGIGDYWEFGGICSRNHANYCRVLARLIMECPLLFVTTCNVHEKSWIKKVREM